MKEYVCQWNAINAVGNATGLCGSSVAHRRFQEWAAGVFLALWAECPRRYDAGQGIA